LNFDCVADLESDDDDITFARTKFKVQMVDSSMKCNVRSANGANWNSQGQVLRAAKHVAPGTVEKLEKH